MISYQWEEQQFAKELYEHLHNIGFSVWMDIFGGIQAALFEDMADAIENAFVVCAIITEKYQKSGNCERELS